jgi:trimethylamine:corrinoid methyltransferase-like protein
MKVTCTHTGWTFQSSAGLLENGQTFGLSSLMVDSALCRYWHREVEKM